MRAYRTEIWYLAITVPILIISMLWLYFDLSAKTKAGTRQQIGFVTYKENRAQRKYSAQVVWESLDYRTPVYNHDSIRTADASGAVIHLNTGTRIQLGDLSMVILNVEKETTDVSFVKGRIKTSSDSGSPVRVRTKDRTIDIDKGDVDFRGSKKGVEVRVNRGEARVSGEEGEQVVKKEQAAVITDKKTIIRDLHLIPQQPYNGQVFFSATLTRPVQMLWASRLQGEHLVILSADSSFSNVLMRKAVQGNKLKLYLPPGNYYWMVGGKNSGGQFEFSQGYRFQINSIEPLKLLGPQNGIVEKQSAPVATVNFSWEECRVANRYLLQVAAGPDFKKIIKESLTESTSIAVKLSPGEYYWRIQAIIPDQPGKINSSVSRFTIERKARPDPPHLFRPENDREIIALIFEKRGDTFSWTHQPDVVNWEISVSGDADFRKLILIKKTTNNFIKIVSKLRPGRYYWRVRGFDQAGRGGSYSNPSGFVISKTRRPALLQPDNRAVFGMARAEGDGISFAWEKSVLGERYRLLMGSERTLRQPMISKILDRPRANLKITKGGTYYWKMEIVGKKNHSILDSVVRTLTVQDYLPQPLLIFPPDRGTVDMSHRNTLPLRWQKSKGSTYYEIHLYRVTDSGKKEVLATRSAGTQYIVRDLGKLDVGRFFWSVRARQKNRHLINSSRESLGSFTIVLKSGPELPADRTTDRQFIEK